MMLNPSWSESGPVLVTFKTILRNKAYFQGMMSIYLKKKKKVVVLAFLCNWRVLFRQVKTQGYWIPSLLAASFFFSPSM